VAAADRTSWKASGNDAIYGGGGFDNLEGRSGNDQIFGGRSEDDTLGGFGIDTCRSPKHADGCER
jgi:Ca2+-binding RTX toxin-like protein